MTDQTAAFDHLLKNLDQALIADRHRLRRQLHELRKQSGTPQSGTPSSGTPQAVPDQAKLAQWLERFQASAAKVEARRLSVPVMRYDEALPTTNVGKILRRELRDEELKKIAKA